MSENKKLDDIDMTHVKDELPSLPKKAPKRMKYTVAETETASTTAKINISDTEMQAYVKILTQPSKTGYTEIQLEKDVDGLDANMLNNVITQLVALHQKHETTISILTPSLPDKGQRLFQKDQAVVDKTAITIYIFGFLHDFDHAAANEKKYALSMVPLGGHHQFLETATATIEGFTALSPLPKCNWTLECWNQNFKKHVP
ncbi:hypothetical protein HDU96_005171, partial [Phlyctochytrium bullatum]